MSEKQFYRLSGRIDGSLADMNAMPDQLNAMASDVGGLCGPLVLSASELADRLSELPPECGGREAVAALRMLDPGTRLRVSLDADFEAQQQWIDRYVAAAHSVIPDGKAVTTSDERRMESSASDDLLEHGVEADAAAYGTRCGIDIMDPPNWDRED